MENFVQLYKTAFIFSQEREYALYGMTCGKAKANTPQAGSITRGGHNVEKKSFEASVLRNGTGNDAERFLGRCRVCLDGRLPIFARGLREGETAEGIHAVIEQSRSR